jgi:hypothetical protein
MQNFRKLGRAAALSMILGVAMVATAPTLEAAGSQHSMTVRCGLMLRAIDSATAVAGADSALVQYLTGLYLANCQG